MCFAELGGGEAYLRAERSDFHGPKEGDVAESMGHDALHLLLEDHRVAKRVNRFILEWSSVMTTHHRRFTFGEVLPAPIAKARRTCDESRRWLGAW